MTAQFLRKIKCAVKFASEQYKREQADLKDMGFVSLFKTACFLFLLRANAARTQTSMHVLSYVTRLRSLLLYLFVVLCDLKPLQVLALFGGPLTLGARGKLPLLTPSPLSAALGK